MAVEIKELVIRAVIRDNMDEKGKGLPIGFSKEKQEALVKECVDQVMQILKDKSYR